MIEENIEEAQSSALPIGSKLKEFEIVSILGAGGFGITYKVKDTNLDTMMVIKEYMPNAFASRNNNTTVTCISTNLDTFEWGMQRFLEEARTLRRFDHISIVKTHRVFRANNTAYFVMDFYEGETLDDYLKRHPNKQFSQDEILSVMMPIIEGLKVVHKEKFLHRDIAPDNIFLRQTKPPILIDFGASRNALGVQSQNISAIVKHGYSPPEQYTSNSIQDGTTDLYAISAVIYEMITGAKPPESTHRQTEMLNDNRDPIENIEQKYKDRFSSSFLKTIKLGLSIRQKDRIQTIREFQKGLVKKDKSLPISKIVWAVSIFVVLAIGGYIVSVVLDTTPDKIVNKDEPTKSDETPTHKKKEVLEEKRVVQVDKTVITPINNKIENEEKDKKSSSTKECSDYQKNLGLCTKDKQVDSIPITKKGENAEKDKKCSDYQKSLGLCTE